MLCDADYPDSIMATVTAILFEHCYKFADINISSDQNVVFVIFYLFFQNVDNTNLKNYSNNESGMLAWYIFKGIGNICI